MSENLPEWASHTQRDPELKVTFEAVRDLCAKCDVPLNEAGPIAYELMLAMQCETPGVRRGGLLKTVELICESSALILKTAGLHGYGHKKWN